MRERRTCCLPFLCLLVACGEGGGSASSSNGAPVGAAVPQVERAVPPAVRSGPCNDPGAPDAMLIALSFDGTHGIQSHESVSVSCDGQVAAQRVRDAVPLGAPAPLRLDAAELDRARELAREILRAPAAPLDLPPQGFDTTVSVYSDPIVNGRPGTNAAYGRAYEWLSALRDRAFPPPTYRLAITLSRRPSTSSAPEPLPPGLSASRAREVFGGIIVSLQNQGPDAVEHQIEPVLSRLAWQGGESPIAEVVRIESVLLGSDAPAVTMIDPQATITYLVRPTTPPPPDAPGLSIVLTVTARGRDEVMWSDPMRLEAQAR